MNNFFKMGGVKMGINCRINCNILTAESYLIELGDNVTISDHVSFITHDNSISKVLPGQSDLYGRIIIGNDCFIGAHSILMYGVTLEANTIVASGSVVTKSFNEKNIIIGGNPARIIGHCDKYAEKSRDKAVSLSSLPAEEKRKRLMNGELLVKR